MYRLPYPENGPKLECVRVYESLPMDAGFDDDAWSRSPIASNFWSSSKAGGRDDLVEAKFAYDDSHLYIIARVGTGDATVSSIESTLEIFIDPGKHWSHLGPYQFAYNAKGRIKGAFAWNCPWPRARTTQNSDGSWTISTAFSWQILDMSHPRADTEVGVGIAHIQAEEGEQAVQRLPPQGGPPVVFRYGRLVLE